MIDNVYIILDRENPRTLVQDVKRLFPELNLFSSIFLLSENLADDFDKVSSLVNEISIFLKGCGFNRVNLNIVHPFFSNARQYYTRLGSILEPFNVEGYVYQSTPRLVLLPVIIAEGKSQGLVDLLNFLEDQFMMPSVYQKAHFDIDAVERLFIEPACAKEPVDTLGFYHIFHDLLDKIDYPDNRVIRSCGTNLVMGRDGRFYPCQVNQGDSLY